MESNENKSNHHKSFQPWTHLTHKLQTWHVNFKPTSNGSSSKFEMRNYYSNPLSITNMKKTYCKFATTLQFSIGRSTRTSSACYRTCCCSDTLPLPSVLCISCCCTQQLPVAYNQRIKISTVKSIISKNLKCCTNQRHSFDCCHLAILMLLEKLFLWVKHC